MLATESRGVYFDETQRWPNPIFLVLVFAIALFAWWAFVRQIVGGVAIGAEAAEDWVVFAVFCVFGLLLPLGFLSLQLRVVVTGDEVDVHLFPLRRRRIPLGDIRECTARIYRPLREYGGWGLRWSPRGWVYSLRGRHGVQLTLTEGHPVLIGTPYPEQLADAIRQAQAARGVRRTA
jgi:hypothetical protein